MVLKTMSIWASSATSSGRISEARVPSASGRRMRLGTFVQVGDGQFGALGPERLGDAVGDRLVIGDTNDECLLARKKTCMRLLAILHRSIATMS